MKEGLKDIATGVKDIWTGDFFNDSPKQEIAKKTFITKFINKNNNLKLAVKGLDNDNQRKWFKAEARKEFDFVTQHGDLNEEALIKALEEKVAEAADPIRGYQELDEKGVSGLRKGARSVLDTILKYSGYHGIGKGAEAMANKVVPRERQPFRAAAKGVFGGGQRLGQSFVDALKSK